MTDKVPDWPEIQAQKEREYIEPVVIRIEVEKGARMNPSTFVSVTTWASILIMVYGILFKIFDNSFTTWFLFGFLCVMGVLKWLIDVSENYRSKK